MYDLKIVVPFGIEAVLKKELKILGYKEIEVVNGAVYLKAVNEIDLYRLSLLLRSADRIFILLKKAKTYNFDDLFELVKSINWGELFFKNSKIITLAKRKNSTIRGIPSIQAITKKAIVDVLRKHYKTKWLSENGGTLKILINIENDESEILLDTSGKGLYRRGYKKYTVPAPLRENIASSIILLSGWKAGIPLWDPFCGSGTIAIEAYMLSKNIPPGIFREFAFMKLKTFNKQKFNDIKNNLISNIHLKKETNIICSDIDENALKYSKANFKTILRAINTKNDIKFIKSDYRKVKLDFDELFIITNPPYGKRMGNRLFELYRGIGNLKKENRGWKFFIISGYEKVEKAFGLKAPKKRKLYNGKIKTYLYQYF